MIKDESARPGFWKKRIKISYVLCIAALGVLSLGYGQFTFIKTSDAEKQSVILPQNDCPPPPVVRYRMNNYKYTHPLLLSDVLTESKELLNLKNEVAQMINGRKQSGQISSASVYIRSLNDNKWVSINGDAEYNPGSLIKVPVMMTYLRESEKNPGLLDKKLSLQPSSKVPPQTFKGDRIEPGKQYSVKELLYYMIAKSDNYATLLLNENVNIPEFKRLFVDLGLPEPDMHDPVFKITAAGYSKFFRVLYNASYLNNEDAEFALSLLAQSSFKDGMLKFLPADAKVAHKFGEWGDAKNPLNHQLHESGIIFLGDSPMLITIMTKGENVNPLPRVISEITRLIYDRMIVEKPRS